MQLFAPSLAFVDLETTGMRAGEDRITEVGIVRVDMDPDGGPPRVAEWSSLVDPEMPIPSVIQALTGITDAMVAGAPTFGSIATHIEERLDGAVFIAHNARFDHGFLKHAFARIGRPMSARALCTVRLSRRLYPDAQGHGLDAIVARHDLTNTARHRALGDARVLWSFVEMLYREHPAETIAAAVKRILKIPSLPPQLSPDALDALPEGPGIYFFYGENPLPLYIGKSVHLRERVGAHFTSDWRQESDLRLSQEIRRIEFESTAGELGALIREAIIIKRLLPAHNRALRRKADAGVLRLVENGPPQFIAASDITTAELVGAYGPFSSKRGAREALRALAGEHALCWRRLGIEKRAEGPCFQRQIKRCAGACVGLESGAEHDVRLQAALANVQIPPWPIDGIGVLREVDVAGQRTDVHVLRDWCWLGTARDEGELAALLECPPAPQFDLDVARMLLKRYTAGKLPMHRARVNAMKATKGPALAGC
ncbi:MAG: exonuclease domain-containing protein [Betaproteobacteria bacterium]